MKKTVLLPNCLKTTQHCQQYADARRCIGHSRYLSIRHHRFHRKQPFWLFPLIDDVMSKLQCKSKLYKQIRIIVVPRVGKINCPWSRSRSKLSSRHCANWKDFFQGPLMQNINVISCTLQKILARLEFVWQTEGRTDKPIHGRTNGF